MGMAVLTRIPVSSPGFRRGSRQSLQSPFFSILRIKLPRSRHTVRRSPSSSPGPGCREARCSVATPPKRSDKRSMGNSPTSIGTFPPSVEDGWSGTRPSPSIRRFSSPAPTTVSPTSASLEEPWPARSLCSGISRGGESTDPKTFSGGRSWGSSNERSLLRKPPFRSRPFMGSASTRLGTVKEKAPSRRRRPSRERSFATEPRRALSSSPTLDGPRLEKCPESSIPTFVRYSREHGAARSIPSWTDLVRLPIVRPSPQKGISAELIRVSRVNYQHGEAAGRSCDRRCSGSGGDPGERVASE